MARVCDLTGTKTSFGNSKKHRRGRSGAGGVWRFKAPKTRRTWKPNLRKAKIQTQDGVVKVKVSMKAYKRLKKENLVVTN